MINFFYTLEKVLNLHLTNLHSGLEMESRSIDRPLVYIDRWIGYHYIQLVHIYYIYIIYIYIYVY